MSLSKQLLILISFIFLLIFITNFLLSLNNIKSYLEGEAQVHMQDTATSLGLSISPHIADVHDPIIRTMMNAIFDQGYYKEIRLIDIDGNDLILLTNSEQIAGVPDWLPELMPMQTAIATSEISSGWSISATLFVTANPGYAYLKLYQQAKRTFLFTLLIFVAAISLLILILRLTLKPLTQIQQQANDIALGNFTIIDQLPTTLEVRSLTKSMNIMSSKTGDMIKRLNVKVNTLTENLKRDPLTNLYNQDAFNTKLKQLLASAQSGYSVFIKIDDLAAIAKDKGKDVVDTLLTDFAAILVPPEQADTITAYRLYGSEFTLICPQFDATTITPFAEDLNQRVTELGLAYQLNDLVHIGIVHFERTSSFEQLLPAMIEAYKRAKQIGHNAYFIQTDSIASLSEHDWKELIQQTINQDRLDIDYISPAYNYTASEPIQIMEEAFSVVKDQQGNNVSIATFISMAQELGLEIEFDQRVVTTIIARLASLANPVAITINLSMASIASPTFRSWLQQTLASSDHIGSLVFSLAAYSAAKDLAVFTDFNLFIRSLGAKVLLKRYSPDLIPIESLKELNIDFVRLARDLTTDLSERPDKIQLLEIIHEVTSMLSIKVITEQITSSKDFQQVKSIGFYGIGQ